MQSNGDILLDDNVLIALDDGQIQASSATYFHNQKNFYNLNFLKKRVI